MTIQLPDFGLESSRGWLEFLGPLSTSEGWTEIPGSWYDIGSTLAIWGVNLRWKTSLSAFLSFCVLSAFQIFLQRFIKYVFKNDEYCKIKDECYKENSNIKMLKNM